MNKLLAANLMRLRKNWLFWGLLIVMLGFGLIQVLSQFREQVVYAEFGVKGSLDVIFFNFAAVIGLAAAVFSSLFLGTEYSDGAIRNKLIVGHSRTNIYFANLITNIAAAFLMSLAYLVAVIAAGTPLFGYLTIEVGTVFLMLLGIFVMTAGLCSIFTLVSMSCANKTAVAAASILGVFFLLFIAVLINTRLSAAEYIPSYSLVNGEVVETMEANPQYLVGAARVFWQFVYDLLPTGQAIQYSEVSVIHPWRLPLYSLAIALVSTAAGTALFKRKDLK